VQAKESLRAEKVAFDDAMKIGVMIEVPSAAVVAGDIAREVDFLSIGTNDLIQYLLAVDRGNDIVSQLYQEFEPAVILTIRHIIKEAHKNNIPVSMCGEMAGDPVATLLLLGLGLDEFSVIPYVLPEIKKIIRSVPLREAQKIAVRAMKFSTVEEVKELLENISIWSDYRAYVASLLAASSGLRLGEILGLVISDYHPEGRYIHCRRSWDQYLRRLNPTTKTGRARNVFIPPSVITALDKLIALSPNPKTSESFIFYADKSYIYPTEPKIITKAFFKAMEDIGISEKERRERNITFHSHRHFLNSLLVNANIPIQKIQSITGHLTAEMTQHYYHLDDMRDVQQVQEGIFDFGTAI